MAFHHHVVFQVHEIIGLISKLLRAKNLAWHVRVGVQTNTLSQ